MEFDNIFGAKKEHTAKDFLRSLLINLANEGETPVDIGKAKFSAITSRTRETILAHTHIEMDYSVSIGYDREETYIEKKQKRDPTTNRYYYEEEKKTRIVTDWSPHSGHIGGDVTTAAFNEKCSLRGLDQHDLILDVIRSISKSSFIVSSNATPSNYGIQTIRENSKDIMRSRISLPGDRYKDFNATAQIKADSISCWKLPYYDTQFTYNGETYKAGGFASGNYNLTSELPPNDVNLEQVAEKETEKSQNAMIAWWAAFIGLFIAAVEFFSIDIYWFWVVVTISLIVAICMHRNYNKKFNEKLASLSDDIASSKIKALKNTLKKYAFEPLSKEEEASFKKKCESNKNDYQSYHNRTGGKGIAILACIATVILIGVSFTKHKEALHSPEQITISVTSKTETNSLKGNYIISFNYQISANKVGVSDMEIIMHISDKSGQQLATLTTNLKDMALSAGSTKNYSVEWTTKYPSSNFSTVYDGSLQNLVFEYELDEIRFDDGEYYRN